MILSIFFDYKNPYFHQNLDFSSKFIITWSSLHLIRNAIHGEKKPVSLGNREKFGILRKHIEKKCFHIICLKHPVLSFTPDFSSKFLQVFIPDTINGSKTYF